jgi:cytochrome c-type biogenesis protein
MSYFITFLEGLIAFISPCVLPLLPLYIMYFAGGKTSEKKGRALVNSAGFVLGFTTIFVLFGLFASTIGGFLVRYKTTVNLVTGAIVVLFGLHYAGLLKISLLDRTIKPKADIRPSAFFSAILFGAVFAVGWSPCTGAFLGSALMMASQQASWLNGMLLLLAYSLGLGVPFLLCAVLIDRLKNAFDLIKKHYRVINTVCGIFLIITGILMMTGVFSRITLLLK